MNARNMTVRILKRSAENLQQSKDEEYAYWQSRPRLERLLATQELSFAFFEGRHAGQIVSKCRWM